MKGERGTVASTPFHPSSFILHPFCLKATQQFVHAFAFFFNYISHKMNLRCAWQVQGEAELLANIRRGFAQRTHRIAMFCLISGDRDVNTHIAEVLRKSNIGDSHHRQARILEFKSNNLRDLFANSVCDSLCTTHLKSGGRSRRQSTRLLHSAPAVCTLHVSE